MSATIDSIAAFDAADGKPVWCVDVKGQQVRGIAVADGRLVAALFENGAARWVLGDGVALDTDSPAALDRAHAFYQTNKSIPGALAAAGLRGSDFIAGWKRRDEPLDIALVDEASMIEARQLEDLTEIEQAQVIDHLAVEHIDPFRHAIHRNLRPVSLVILRAWHYLLPRSFSYPSGKEILLFISLHLRKPQ